jgi:hypothetical protein
VARTFQSDACSLPKVSRRDAEAISQSGAIVAIAYLRSYQGRKDYMQLSTNLVEKNAHYARIDGELTKRFIARDKNLKRCVVSHQRVDIIEKQFCPHKKNAFVSHKRAIVPPEMEDVFCNICREFFTDHVAVTDILYQSPAGKSAVMTLPESLRTTMYVGKSGKPNTPTYPAVRAEPGPRDLMLTMGISMASAVYALGTALSWI